MLEGSGTFVGDDHPPGWARAEPPEDGPPEDGPPDAPPPTDFLPRLAPTLDAALLRAGLVDELHVITVPALVGGLGTPSIVDGPPPEPGSVPVALRTLDVTVGRHGSVWAHYEVRRARRNPTSPRSALVPCALIMPGGEEGA